MFICFRGSALLVLVLTLGALPLSSALAEKKVALILGNGAYVNVPILTNPQNDASAIESMLKSAGFNTIVRADNYGVTKLRRTLNDFSDLVQDADVAVIFYAGHGIEVNGTNYLIPVDAALKRDVDVEDEAVSLERVSRTLGQAKLLRLVILDACRDNPFVQSMKRSVLSRSVRSGHGEIDERSLPANTLIAYAQRAGETAADGVAGTHNSPYTVALLKHLVTPGLDVELALRRVRDDVLKATKNRQEPFKYGSLGGAEIPLVPGSVTLDDQRQRELERQKLEAEKRVNDAESRVQAAVAAAEAAKAQRAEAERMAALNAQRATDADERAELARKGALQLVPPPKPRCETPVGSPFRVVGVESNDVLNMRLGPTANSAPVYAIPFDGKGVYKRTCTTSGGATWCEVAYDCRVGWVNTRFLEPDSAPGSRVVGVDTNDKLWVRPVPGDLSSKVAGLEPDTIGIEKLTCQRVGTAQWCQIRYGSIVGWVNAKYISD